jgi:hypothetical protein
MINLISSFNGRTEMAYVQPKIKKNQEKENTDNIINGYSPPALHLHPHHNSTV